MKVSIICRPQGHQNVHAVALDAGLRALGIQTERRNAVSISKADLVACWGWRPGRMYHEAGARVLVMERGYLGDRFAWTSLGFDGLNGRATFPSAPEDGGARFETHHGELLRPWRSGGDYVLIIGQVPGDAALGGRDLRGWYAEQAKRAALEYHLPVIFRPHPLAPRRGPVYPVPGTIQHKGPLSEALARAAVVVTYNSNTAVESVLAGVPTIAMDRGSMAYEVCAHAIGETLITPDRRAWAHALAWKQWRLEEIASGAALEHVLQLQAEAA